jgi:ferritin
MLISKKMNEKLNEQINFEQYSAHTYLGMATALESMGLKVLAGHFFKHAEEEQEHAMKMIKYVLGVGGTVTLKAIDEPKGKWDSVENIAKQTLDHELEVTKRINELVALAEEEKDYATRSFLQWYVDEQVEEVSNAEYLLGLAKMAGPQQVLNLEARVAQLMG